MLFAAVGFAFYKKTEGSSSGRPTALTFAAAHNGPLRALSVFASVIVQLVVMALAGAPASIAARRRWRALRLRKHDWDRPRLKGSRNCGWPGEPRRSRVPCLALLCCHGTAAGLASLGDRGCRWEASERISNFSLRELEVLQLARVVGVVGGHVEVAVT